MRLSNMLSRGGIGDEQQGSVSTTLGDKWAGEKGSSGERPQRRVEALIL